MATPSEKLATSLEVLHELQARGVIAIRSKDLTRTHRERLLENGFLQEVMKGWYIASRPDEGRGDSTGSKRGSRATLLQASPHPDLSDSRRSHEAFIKFAPGTTQDDNVNVIAHRCGNTCQINRNRK